RTELAVLTGRGDLRQHVLVNVAFGVAIAHVEFVELVDDLGEQRRPWDLEAGVTHVARVGGAFSIEISDEREDMLVDDAEHLRAGEMLESRPAKIRKRLAPRIRIARLRKPVITLGEETPLDWLAERGGLALLQLLHLIEAL